MNVYLDSSAIVKLFDSREAHHGFLVEALTRLSPRRQFTSVLAFPECMAAFASKPYSDAKLATLNARFLQTWEEDYSKVHLDQDILLTSGILVRTHRKRRLRGADAVHLASILRVGAQGRSNLAMAVFDRVLAEAAVAEGFKVIADPAFGLDG